MGAWLPGKLAGKTKVQGAVYLRLCTTNTTRLLYSSVSMATKKSSEAELSAEEEENDMLLYLWQKAAFMDSGQGIPREMADSLRLRVAQLSSYHSKMLVVTG